MRNLFRPLALAGLVMMALGPAAFAADAQITAAVAASAQYAMEDLRAEFRKGTGAEVKTVYGSSGKLAAQIKNGAPFDVFVSADMDYPDSLSQWGYAAAKARPYAYGKLVLWTMKDLDPARGMAVLSGTGAKKIALADPERAPYGREAVKALRKAGVYEAVKGKLVFGESIAQASQYILLGTADIGITAKSVVLAGGMRGKGKWAEVDSSAYDPIAQGAVICKYGTENHPVLAAKFLEYLYSPPARSILSRYGYAPPIEPAKQ